MPPDVPRLRTSSAGRTTTSQQSRTPIQKKSGAPPAKQPTQAASKSAQAASKSADSEMLSKRPPSSGGSADLRLVGVPLTRSKSDRARLVALAEGALAADALGDLPLKRSAASDVSQMLGDFSSLPAVPLTRSAASELAISLGEGMSF